jgi:hypothetical protein
MLQLLVALVVQVLLVLVVVLVLLARQVNRRLVRKSQ